MSRQTPENPVILATGINKFHSMLLLEMKGILVGETLIIDERNSNPIESWKTMRPGPIEFYLRRPRTEYQDFAGHGSDSNTPVVRLNKSSKIKRKVALLNWWVSWRERWRSEKNGKFKFEAAGWSLYCSNGGGDKVLLMRAEWAMPSEKEPENAGQPHWHVHQRLPLYGGSEDESFPNEPLAIDADAEANELDEEPSAELIEIIDQPLEELATSRSSFGMTAADTTSVHLGMAGWHHGGGLPRCWQLPIGSDPTKSLRTWSIAVLAYMQCQLPYIHTS